MQRALVQGHILSLNKQPTVSSPGERLWKGEVAEAHDGSNHWIALFAAACRRAVQDASRFEEQVRALQSSWLERVGHLRRDSAARLLIEELPAAPMLTTSTAAALIGRSFQAASQAIDRLVRAGVLTQVSLGRRNRVFEAPELIEAFTSLERHLASPSGDTRVSEPARRVPRRLE